MGKLRAMHARGGKPAGSPRKPSICAFLSNSVWRHSVNFRRVFLMAVVLMAGAAAQRTTLVSGDDWLPISPEELKMTSVPEAPGAPAVYLYRQVDRDDSRNGHEYNYVRIKILTEEGRKYGDVEIPFFKGEGNIS